MGPVLGPMAGFQPFPSIHIVRTLGVRGTGKPGNHRGPGPLWTRYIRKRTAGGVSEDRRAPVPGAPTPTISHSRRPQTGERCLRAHG